MLNPKTLAKLSPEGRKAILNMEAKLEEIKQEQEVLDLLLERFK
jgi:hypothetical protein